ncbi:MAG: GNAT family N-acetyltransferase [Lysobacteraceae bacterium]
MVDIDRRPAVLAPGGLATWTQPAPWPFPLETHRVCVRPLHVQDIDGFLAYRSDPDIARFQGWSPMDRPAALAFLHGMAGVSGPRAGDWVQLGFAVPGSGELAGDIGLFMSPDGHRARIGYSCARRFQRRGLTSAAVSLVVDRVFATTPCAVVQADIDSRNLASERLLVRVGFALADAQVRDDEGRHTIEMTYAMARSDWQARTC